MDFNLPADLTAYLAQLGARERSLGPIARVVGMQFQRRPGNCRAFASGFDYLDRAKVVFAGEFPRVPAWSQSRGMSDEQRRAFLGAFVPGGFPA